MGGGVVSGPVIDAGEFRCPRCWWRRQEEVAAKTAICFSRLLAAMYVRAERLRVLYLPLLSNRTAEVARTAACLDHVVRDRMIGQFNFNGQMNWNATEANWRLAMDPRAAEDYGTIEAAAFVAESRTVRPGTWPNGIYVRDATGKKQNGMVLLGTTPQRKLTSTWRPQEPARPELQEPTTVITSEQRLVVALADGVQAA